MRKVPKLKDNKKFMAILERTRKYAKIPKEFIQELKEDSKENNVLLL